MGHVASVIGGVRVDAKVSEQAGAVWQVVPVVRQRAALRFLASQTFDTPAWLLPADVMSRIGPAGSAALSARQSGIITSLTTPARLDRMASSAVLQPGVGYDMHAYLGELTGLVLAGAAPDANRRQLHRAYVDRLEALVSPPAPAAAGPGGGQGGGPGGGAPAVNVRRTDISSAARAQLRAVLATARTNAAASTGTVSRAHWLDLVDRAQAILEPAR